MFFFLWAGYKQCSDGILNPGEECDDGNLVANDGCGPDCKLENASQFLCTLAGINGPTQCCPARINPVTGQKVCNCVGQASDSAGYSISADCRFGLFFLPHPTVPFAAGMRAC